MKNFEKQITANLKKGQKENEFRGKFETILKQIRKKKCEYQSRKVNLSL